MENPYESPRSESQPVARPERIPRQWRLAAFVLGFVALPAISNAVTMILLPESAWLYAFFGSIALSAFGVFAVLQRSDASFAICSVVFLFAVLSSVIMAFVGIYFGTMLLYTLFDIDLLDD